MNHINSWLSETSLKSPKKVCIAGRTTCYNNNLKIGKKILHLTSSWAFSIKALTCCFISCHIITQKNDPSVTWGESFWIFIKRKKKANNTSLTFPSLWRTGIIWEKWIVSSCNFNIEFHYAEAIGMFIFDSQKRNRNFIWFSWVRAVIHSSVFGKYLKLCSTNLHFLSVHIIIIQIMVLELHISPACSLFPSHPMWRLLGKWSLKTNPLSNSLSCILYKIHSLELSSIETEVITLPKIQGCYHTVLNRHGRI